MKRHFQYCIVAILVVAGSSISTHCAAQNFERNGDEITYRGNKFILKSLGLIDTMTITDPVTEKEITKTYDVPPQPVTMNGKKIYEMNEVTTSAGANAMNIPIEYVLKNFKEIPWVKAMRDGLIRIYIKRPVLDENGKVVYYDQVIIQYKGKDNQTRTMNGDATVDSLLANAPTMKTATLNGNKVIVRLQTSLPDYIIAVNNHTTILRKGPFSYSKK